MIVYLFDNYGGIWGIDEDFNLVFIKNTKSCQLSFMAYDIY